MNGISIEEKNLMYNILMKLIKFSTNEGLDGFKKTKVWKFEKPIF